MARPIDARIRDLERQSTRVETLRRKQINGERFVIGALMIDAARRSSFIRDLLLGEIAHQPMREMDRRRIEPLIDELRELAAKEP